jgi:hypothetical protein
MGLREVVPYARQFLGGIPKGHRKTHRAPEHWYYSSKELKQKVAKAWEYARFYHTRDKYRDEYGNIVIEIIRTYHC